MSEFASVLKLAQAVTRETNLISEGEESRLKAEQVLTRVDEVKGELAKLSQVVTAARRLTSESAEAAVDLTGLDDGLKSFSGYVSRDGLPLNSAFNSARGKIGAVHQRVSAGLTAAWTDWTGAKRDAVPEIRIALLDKADRKAANDRWAELVKLAKQSPPTVSDIIAVKSALSHLHELLDDLTPPGGPVLAILERLGEPRRVTLADLTDADIAELRKANVADQIVVRREVK